jgi:Holliday junction resolvasome RuvABC endonuclease subunit
MCNSEGIIVRYILGIDQSYTSAGFVILDESGDVKKFGTIRSNADTNGDIFDRAAFVTRSILDIAVEYDPALVGLEGLAFSKFGNATRDLAGLQFVIITQLRTTKYGSNLVIISPNLVKKFATGKGGADKAAMVEAMPEKLVDEIKEANYKKTTGLYDIADAYWIAKYTLEEYKKLQS